MVYFFEKNHEYFNIYNEQYLSVSGLLKKYIEDFDSEFSSQISAFREYDETLYTKSKEKYKWYDKEILNYLISLVDEETYIEIQKKALLLRDDWECYSEERSEYGTGIHSEKENIDISNGFKINPIDGLKYKVVGRKIGYKYDNAYILKDVLKMKENICLLEGLLVDHESKTCGQEDVIFLKYMGNGVFVAYNLDYKTDKEIKMKSFFVEKGNRKLKGILNPFQDCSFYIYSLKQSVYALMLEKEGVKVLGNYLMHIPENGEPIYIQTPYYKKYAELIMKERLQQIQPFSKSFKQKSV